MEDKNFLENLPHASSAPKPKVDLSKCDSVVCTECGSGLFEDSVILKIISGIMSGTGNEEIAPVPVFSCVACGAVPERFLKIAAEARIG